MGSDTQLVAPVKVASGATIGAGTTITRDVGENELVITRVAQRHIQGWQRPIKKNKIKNPTFYRRIFYKPILQIVIKTT